MFRQSCCSLHHYDGAKVCTFMANFYEDFFICLTTFFQKYFEWRSCIIFMKEVMSLTIVTMEIVKSQFLSYHNNSCLVQKKLYQKFEFDGLELPLEKID